VKKKKLEEKSVENLRKRERFWFWGIVYSSEGI
jgi:hypothetical protein